MANDMIKFLRGNVANLPQTATAGAVYFTKDEGLYLGLEDGSYHRYGDFITVADVNSLPESGAHETCMYYCESENILAKWDGAKWVQINKQKTLAELGGVAKSVYDAKMALLEKADSDNAAAISELAARVGTIPTGEDGQAVASSVVAYVDKKTAGIATEGALTELTARVTTAEGDIDKLEAALAEGGDTAKAIADAKKAGTDAQDAVNTLAGKVGEVPAEKTVIGLIGDAQAQADKGVEDAATAQAKADEAYTLASGKATQDDIDTAIANAGHAVKDDVDKAIADLDAAYKKADGDLKTELEGKINAKVDQTAYDTKIGELAGADTTLQGNIEAEATARSEADTALSGRITTLEGQITGLSGAMHFKGVEDAIPEGEDLAVYADGDVIIVGDKEYVFNDGAFVEFGDVSAEGDRIAELERLVGKEAEGENAATGLVKAAADNAAAIAAEKARAEGKEAELAQADATNLQAAKDYADGKIADLKIGDYAKQADLDAHTGDTVAHITAAERTAWNAAEKNAKDYADGLKATIDAAYADADSALSGRIKDLEDNKAGYATTTQVATAKSEAIAEAATDAANKDAVVLAEAQKGIAAVQTALDEYKDTNNAEVAKKANAADVYAKTDTYTKAEVEALITAAQTWGTF